ncbi:putative hydro-lyase [Hoeflea sp.]|uniref:putative hydro-lyase n=1 Tax=Hoeflea sp. TaxID=1940281 RepID=UPI0037492C7B
MTVTLSHAQLLGLPVEEVRAAIRSGAYTGHTAGLAAGKLQANLVILPAAEAKDFAEFCRSNPRPCPVVAQGEAGNPMLSALGDIDIRTDVPAFNVYRNGGLDRRVEDLSGLWRDDLVIFALGCSFTFERALMEDGIAMRHISQDKTVPMFRTNVDTVPAGPFGGGLVVSMRPIAKDQVERASEITARYPQAHGAPVHVGDPAVLGIGDLNSPDWGDPVEVLDGEVPVFWACGVTPQNAIRQARPRFCITHAPGHMLIADTDEMAPVGAFSASAAVQAASSPLTLANN